MAVEGSNKVNFPREIRLTALCLMLTIAICGFLGQDMVSILVERAGEGDNNGVFLQSLFICTIAFLLYGCFVYQFARLGQLRRRRVFKTTNRNALESIYQDQAPTLAVLVPSYREDPEVVARTLLSAALLDYPHKQIVLLIDDPQNPGTEADRLLLEHARGLPAGIRALLGEQAEISRSAFNDFVARRRAGALDTADELTELASLYEDAAEWLANLEDAYPINSHEDRWFIANILRAPARSHRCRAEELRQLARADIYSISDERLFREYSRLRGLFQAEISYFERKRYVNLSHEPNKAMNLNSYIGLMGGRYCDEQCDDGLHLVPCDGSRAGRYFADTDFVITLDADSLLLSDYALKLVSVMREVGNHRLAVAQTPYSAFPNAPSIIERIAGATTDIQYLVHQGFTYYNSTFWVGANALLRKIALEDIATTDTERGYPITRYIQDRTVIEDTESSVDLVDRGWRLYNYPERLACSSTPPDFGSLLIQRRRWANGGLIILPKFLRYITGRGHRPHRFMHGLLGMHYLTSLAGANLAMMLILVGPFEQAMRTPWLPMAVLPYFFLYGRDLVLSGYRVSDLFRVSALSLLLVPVNLGGVFKSVQQLVTGKRTPFGRTPKVSDRTTTPLIYLALIYGFAASCVASLVMDIHEQRWMHAALSGVTGAILLYAIKRFIGVRGAWADVVAVIQTYRPEPVVQAEAEPVTETVREVEQPAAIESQRA